MPFLTEELWQNMQQRSSSEALLVSTWPKGKDVDASIISSFELTKKLVSGVRNFRKQRNISFKEKITLHLVAEASQVGFHDVLCKLAGVDAIHWEKETPATSGAAFRVESIECFIPLDGNVYAEEERKKLEEELQYAKGFLASVRKKLDNERFVSNAPEKVIEIERKKEADALEKIALLEKSLSSL